MDPSRKSSRDMILDRFAAANINTDQLAIEAAADSVRITGSVPTEAERGRVLAVLGDMQAQGVRSTHEIHVRAVDNAGEDAPPSPDIRYPPEPA
jgi:hypothetical protein